MASQADGDHCGGSGSPATSGRPNRVSVATLLAAMLWLPGPAQGSRALAQTPHFNFVQISDSQPGDAADQLAFQDVLDTIVAGGQPGALLPRPIDLVLFAGDLVDHTTIAEWIGWVTTIDLRLTANGIPYRAVPGNHDQEDGGFGLYEQFIGDSGVWHFSSSTTGHNGIPWSTNWAGLRVIGFNNSNGGWNTILAEDLARIDALVTAAQDDDENVLLLCHHPHDGEGVVPLQAALGQLNVVGYMRGHSGSPHASHGLAGIANPNAWDLNSNSIVDDGGLIYYEVFTTHILAYVIELADDPTALPDPEAIPLVHDLRQIVPTPPVAQFIAAPLVGPAPLSVAFTDLSSGIPERWTWTFGDGDTSDAQNPVHVYDTSGTYTVTLHVQNSLGADSQTMAGYITAEEPSTTITLMPVADARVKSTSPSNNYGTEDMLRLRDGSPDDDTYQSYLKFDLTGIEDAPLGSVVLRLRVTDGSPDGGTIYSVANSWAETGITWSNAPPLGGIPLGAAGAVTAGTMLEFDISGIVTGPAVYSFGLRSDSSNSVYFWSREGAGPPEIVIMFDAACKGAQCPPGEGCAGGDCEPLCGNGVVDVGEGCANCPQDVICPSSMECLGGACELLCGNGVVDPGEDCSDCPQDVACPPGLECVGGDCERLCGNGVADAGEDCATCPLDVTCPPGMECVGGACTPLCGNTLPDPGEDCDTCPDDIQCPPGSECIDGLCEALCGNGVADPGETCLKCPQDVQCPPGSECIDGLCEALCGNGAHDPGEDCTKCPQDVACPPGTECLVGMCEPLCGNGISDPGEDCANCPADVTCPPGTQCRDGACVPVCPWDLDGSRAVDLPDLLQLLSLWGPSSGEPADFNADGFVEILDLLELLANWGPCS